MNKHVLLLSIFLSFCVGLINVCADNSKSDAPARKNDEKSSSFLPDKFLRDPFWEIGWQPEFIKEIKKDESEEKNIDLKKLIRWKKAEKLIAVTALGKKTDGTYYAILKNNAGVVEKGVIISRNYRGLTYRWKILSITSKGVLPKKLDVRPIK